jgi:hypothetical protein
MYYAPGKYTTQKDQEGTNDHLAPELRGTKLFSSPARAGVLGRQTAIGSKGKRVGGGERCCCQERHECEFEK